jgi:hypothetical protein
MGTFNLIANLSTVLLIPLLPAFILYRFLPSKTAVKGPFKGLTINLTGAFGGYFLLVLIAIGLTRAVFNNDLTDQLRTAENKINSLNDKIGDLNSVIVKEKGKYHQWKMTGQLDSRSPERTKIFVDEENISINALGKFKATLFIKSDENNKINLPDAVCFFNQAEGYSVIDLSRKEKAAIDTLANEIKIRDKIKLNIPVRYVNSKTEIKPDIYE